MKRLANERKEKIRRRQKLVKLADRNKGGWLVVQEYESNDLASNSEDEKKIKKAKCAAERREKMLGHMAAQAILSGEAKLVVIISFFAVRSS